MILALTGLAVGSYFLGAIPFGVIVAKSQGVDIFVSGSGNPGATNVKRALGTKWGLIVFFLDVLKGLIPALVCRLVTPEQPMWLLIGLVAVLGHSFSPFVGFKGGKGVSSALGAALGATPLIALSAFALFIVVVAVSRYISLGSICAAISTSIFAAIIPGQSRWLIPIYLCLGLLVVWRHRANIQRLRNGTESKFTFKRKPPDPGE